MGASADVNGFFGVMTMVIAVPTGVKVFNWLFTMYGGRVRFTVPVLWSLGFMVTFVIGGMTGVLMAVPPADFQLHNSLFLIAHFHNVIIGGVVFGVMAGFNYWFPKAFGFRLDERWGKAAFWCWLVGFYVAFMPLYALGLMGMTRRMQHYDDKSWQPFLIVAAIGVAIIMAGIVCQIVQLIVSIRARDQLRVGDDPWDGRLSNGLRRRRRRHGIFRSCRMSPGPMPFGWPSNRRSGIRSIRSIGRIQADRDAEEQRPWLYQCLLCRRHWLRADLAYLVDGGSRPDRRILTFLFFAFRDEEEVEVPVEQIAQFERRHQAECCAMSIAVTFDEVGTKRCRARAKPVRLRNGSLSHMASGSFFSAIS